MALLSVLCMPLLDKKGWILGNVIEFTDSEDDENVLMRLAPKPSQASINAVARRVGIWDMTFGLGRCRKCGGGGGLRTIQSLPRSHFHLMTLFFSASEKTPHQQSQPVASPSRIRSPAPVPVPHMPAKTANNAYAWHVRLTCLPNSTARLKNRRRLKLSCPRLPSLLPRL